MSLKTALISVLKVALEALDPEAAKTVRVHITVSDNPAPGQIARDVMRRIAERPSRPN